MTEEQKERRINFRLERTFFKAVQEKARRDHVNLSDLLRGVLREWLDGLYPCIERTQDDSTE